MNTAKQCARCGLVKPLRVFIKEPRNRSGVGSVCILCETARQRRRQRAAYLAQPERAKACAAKYRAQHPEKIRAINARRKLDPEVIHARRVARAQACRATTLVEKRCGACKITKPAAEFCRTVRGRGGIQGTCRVCKSAQTTRWQKANRELVNRKNLAWAAANPAKVNARTARRYAAKTRSTPAWADHEEIQKLYALAQQRTSETGIKHHVDHIVPLRSKIVSGFHVEYNMQVIHAIVNMAKGNRQWPDMP